MYLFGLPDPLHQILQRDEKISREERVQASAYTETFDKLLPSLNLYSQQHQSEACITEQQPTTVLFLPKALFAHSAHKVWDLDSNIILLLVAF